MLIVLLTDKENWTNYCLEHLRVEMSGHWYNNLWIFGVNIRHVDICIKTKIKILLHVNIIIKIVIDTASIHLVCQ